MTKGYIIYDRFSREGIKKCVRCHLIWPRKDQEMCDACEVERRKMQYDRENPV